MRLSLWQVVGAQGTGKTSLLRLLLETAEISPSASPEQRHALDDFLRGAPKRTQEIHNTRIEICESKYDRLLLSAIDTPGLDFQDGHELTLERQVSAIVKYMDGQFADTLSEVRRACCVYILSFALFCATHVVVSVRNPRSSGRAKATTTFICKLRATCPRCHTSSHTRPQMYIYH